ncbi:hypothetical protein [Streptomyces sp. NPDC050504]
MRGSTPRPLWRRLGRTAAFGLVRGLSYGCGAALAAAAAWWAQSR